VPLVVTAQEPVLGVGQARTRSGLSNHQQQVAIPGLHVQHLDIGLIGGLDVEELAMPVVADVDDQGVASESGLADVGNVPE
jgi:hypothetical protein